MNALVDSVKKIVPSEHFDDVRAEPQRATIDLVDERLEFAATGVHRQQAARTVAHQQSTVAGHGQTQRSATGVADDDRLAVVG